MENSEKIEIHGDEWSLEDIKESIEYCREQTWEKRKWLPRPALIQESRVSEYIGQKYDPEKIKLVEDGWTHDHCEICWWTLAEDDDPEKGVGYTSDGRTWICTECHEKFIQERPGDNSIV